MYKLWFSFILGLNFISLWFKVSNITIPKKQGEIIFEPRIQLNHNIYQQVTFDGVTGPVRFSQDGKRAGAQLEILNLRNGSFRKVSTKIKCMVNKLLHGGHIGSQKVHRMNYFCIFYLFELKLRMMVEICIAKYPMLLFFEFNVFLAEKWRHKIDSKIKISRYCKTNI